MVEQIDQLAQTLIAAIAEVSSPVSLMSAAEAAAELGISEKVFRREVRARKIRFVLVGKRRKFTRQDLRDYLNRQRDAIPPCRSTGQKTRRTTTMTLSSKVVAFTDLQAQRAGKTPKR
ncbi:helix-turn-helix domain-containing protein [Telmatospirillum sp. J64-1]|uniref:helix-turn-helix domain-containing protein n=1 Tax=Telmatospirillum sp. J64-1 TaxID=2502183 RepID=UPI00163D78E4|nr:helix-turn-helix domain-containing protein [Telmatospirillum sp. J64-1]